MRVAAAAAGAQLTDLACKFAANESLSCQKNKTKHLVSHMAEDIPVLATRARWLEAIHVPVSLVTTTSRRIELPPEKEQGLSESSLPLKIFIWRTPLPPIS